MQDNNQPQIRSFRLTTKKKHSMRTYTEQKAQSQSSEQSSFSSQYNMLTKKLKLKDRQINKIKLNSTLSSFGGLSSFRVRTQSSHLKTPQGKPQNTLLFFPLSQNSKKTEPGSVQNLRYSTNIVKESNNLKFTTQNFKVRKNFKIQRPSIYWEMSQQSKELSLFHNKKEQKKSQQLIISSQNNKSRLKFLQNCSLLWNIRKQMGQKGNKIKPKDVIKSIKSYIMRKQQRDDSNNTIQKILKQTDDQNDLKQILTCERIIIVGIVELIKLEKIHCLCVECVAILDGLLGFYKYLLSVLFKEAKFFEFGSAFKESQALCTEMDAENIQIKSSLTSTLLYLCTKYQTVYRYSPQLLSKVKLILASSKKSSINRSFYDLLTTFAIYLNETESQNSESSYTNKYISSFITCPSPFIIQARKTKKYSLVLDLDETLIHTKFQKTQATNNNYCTDYRPYCKEFIAELSKHYEIIIFTSSISDYAEEVISPFAHFISHVLCRQHTIKVKGQTIKDLSRIGRSLQTTIIIDNLSQNFKLQPENGIMIKSWYGEKNDRELEELRNVLVGIISSGPKDIRQVLKSYFTQKKSSN